MADVAAPAPRRRRLPSLHLPSVPWRKLLIATAVAVALVAFVPPIRQAVAIAGSRLILFVAKPLAPDTGGFDRLPATTRVLAADGSVLAELSASERREPVELAKLPEHIPGAVLAAEDQRFYEHGGVDPAAVGRALLRNAQGGRQGGSTITQQLAKLNYTGGERTVLRKLREVLYAAELEDRYSKDELLERYLNQVYLGGGAYGFGEAAEVWFAKPAEQLDPAEAAMLAGMIRSPSALDPRKDPEAVKDRRDDVLAAMVDTGAIAKDQLEGLQAKPIEVAPPRPSSAVAPHFVELVKREASELDALGGSPESRGKELYTGGYEIRTTLDRKAFDATVEAVRTTLGEAGDPTTAVATVQPGDGAIRSLFGGLDFQTTQFDVASLGVRQPGSAFKPFVYLTALREGIDPRSRFDGRSPKFVKCFGKEIRNYAGEDAGGEIDLDEAMRDSVNVVFAELGCALGSADVERAGRDAGVPDDATEAQPALFLGGLDRGVTALTMASAYATFAAGGVYAEPYAIASIADREGDVVYEHQPAKRQAFTATEVGVMNRSLIQVVSAGTGRAAAIGRPVAGKTGTTTDNIDGWFVGFVPQLSTAVWVGYPEPKPMRDVHGRSVTGGSFPAITFSKMMTKALEGVPAEPIPTADPEQLDLRPFRPAAAPTSSTSSSSTSSTSSTSTTSTTAAPGAPPTVGPTQPTLRPTTTTTSKKRQTTTSSTSSTTSTTAVASSSSRKSDSTSTTTTTLDD